MIDQHGLLRNFAAMLGANLAYLRARFLLIGLEGKEAAIHYAIILGCAAAALVVVVFGYLFVVLFLVFLIAAAFRSPHAWIWVTLGAAVFHLAAAAGLLLFAKARLAQPVFAATLEEFKKDQQWLKSPGNLN